MYLLGSQKPDMGSIRNTFFYNQVGQLAEVNSSKRGDFLVNDTYTFEVGGNNKYEQQIKGLENAFVVSNDIEMGYNNRIPLWLFDLLY